MEQINTYKTNFDSLGIGEYFFFPWSDVRFRKVDNTHYLAKTINEVREIKDPDTTIHVVKESINVGDIIEKIEVKRRCDSK